MPAWQLVQMSEVGYVMQLNFPINPTFAKLSLLALYFRIFSVNPIFKRWVWLLATLQICWFLAIFLCRVMFCLPIQKLWLAPTPGRCIDPSLLLAAGESVNAVIAFSMIALAMWMVRTLSISNGSKWRLRLLFVLGGLTGVIDIVSIAEAYGTITLNLTYLCLSTLQFIANTICCCAPVYKTIIPKIPDIPILKKIKSKVSMLYESKSDKSENSKDYPLSTLVTIGGTVVKRRGGPEQKWVQLNEPRRPGMSWPDGANTADVETVPDGQAPWGCGPGQQGGQNVHVQRTFEVV
ncbi:hypothetical protein VMCG_10907 [Cytospora schulzeri]|uniref:Rhodopsin domain-containing protein n=1 Tax=Cytospora schulzeri TaxID=448051 RepID=A0A423V7J3_9PEZI|nr:hypothetical protein VMCG_10907 [Valsa malicola]